MEPATQQAVLENIRVFAFRDIAVRTMVLYRSTDLTLPDVFFCAADIIGMLQTCDDEFGKAIFFERLDRNRAVSVSAVSLNKKNTHVLTFATKVNVVHILKEIAATWHDRPGHMMLPFIEFIEDVAHQMLKFEHITRNNLAASQGQPIPFPVPGEPSPEPGSSDQLRSVASPVTVQAMMKRAVRIVSEDGNPAGLRVLDGDGKPINWGSTMITRIEFDPIVPRHMISARFHLINVATDMQTSTQIPEAPK